MNDPFSFIAPSLSSRPSHNSTTSSSQTKKNSSVDAFHDLVSFNVNSTASTQSSNNLTLAERVAKAEQERKTRLNNDTYATQSSFWDKFDTSSAHTPLKPDARPASSSNVVAPSSLADGKSRAVSPAEDSWDFISFDTSKPSRDLSSTSTLHSKQTSPFDSDDGSLLVDLTDTLQPLAVPHPDSPGSFDFGERDERYENHEEDDILGDFVQNTENLSQIVSPKPPQAPPSKAPPSRASSPPRHVLNKLIEMGFPVQQAKQALVETSMDVDAAVEILLRDTIDMPLENPENNSSPELSHRRPLASTSRLPSLKSKEALQEQADNLLLHASSIGLNVFNKANALWKEGREKMVKVYEEQRLGVLGEDKAQTRTRPRWMEDQTPDNHTRFKEDPAESSITAYSSPARHRVSRSSAPAPSISSVHETIPPVASISPKLVSSLSPPSLSPPSHSPAPTPIIRPHIEVSETDLAVSNAAKTKGTEYFKQGRFAEAETSYSRALAALPESHLQRVVLYNNRALARIKIGEYKSGIEDSTMVIRIVNGDLGNSWHPSREPRDGATLAKAVAKAYRRRAESYEGLEKWEDAKKDWETLNLLTWVEASNKKDAVHGITRCRRMLSNGGSDYLHKVNTPIPSSTAAASAKSRPVASSASAAVAGPALSRVRAANLAQEKEDQQRHDLKDTVDGRLEAWRSGKEKNIRALIASLETILPPKFNWQSVGMSELITNNQVKTRYIKVISRLHPDKLSGSDISVEERMIANGVFGTLNEAWNSFR